MLNNTGFVHVGVLIAVFALVAVMVVAIAATVRSGAITPTAKAVWIAIIVLLPLVGLASWALVWFTGGRRAARTARGG
ncbi:MAG: hypothetical protein J0J05_12910 [Microbacterium sp.]|uniref:hypothetical protein n=1 Tax=Microbacterium sp. TaxID=51671 RepID=UPI001AD485A9|nr:hypothetical protein [Microbacterium sp.]MBN9154875.1 hypothetical protein [Microbacterium sp.]